MSSMGLCGGPHSSDLVLQEWGPAGQGGSRTNVPLLSPHTWGDCGGCHTWGLGIGSHGGKLSSVLRVGTVGSPGKPGRGWEAKVLWRPGAQSHISATSALIPTASSQSVPPSFVLGTCLEWLCQLFWKAVKRRV